MLVLARRLGETIVIDGNICVSVVAVKGDRARLGITAPKDVPVDRQEVYERRFALTTTRTENDILAEARLVAIAKARDVVRLAAALAISARRTPPSKERSAHDRKPMPTTPRHCCRPRSGMPLRGRQQDGHSSLPASLLERVLLNYEPLGC